MGRRPTDPEILRLSNSRHAKKYDAKVAKGEPVKPAWLSDDARQCWDELIPILKEHGVCSPLYGLTIALLALALSDYRNIAKQAADAPLVYMGKQHPIHLLLRKAESQLLKLCKEFGLSPASFTAAKRTIPPSADGDKGFTLSLR